jgi:hypothetical protein
MTDRTSHGVITARFMLICAPVGVILALLLLPFAIPILISFFVVLALFWFCTQCFTNTVVKVVDPEGYKAIKQAGGNPFYDSIGAPLNFDSEQVRNQSPVVATVVVPPKVKVQPQVLKQNKLWNGQNIGKT